MHACGIGNLIDCIFSLVVTPVPKEGVADNIRGQLPMVVQNVGESTTQSRLRSIVLPH